MATETGRAAEGGETLRDAELHRQLTDLEQFAREFMQLYPNAKLLVAGKEDLRRDRRKLDRLDPTFRD